jgi:hypothetical protein
MAGRPLEVIVAVSLIVAALLVVPVPAYPLDNVLGWQNTRWGMTESEVKGSVESSGLRLVSLAGPDGRPLDAGSPFKTNIRIDGSDYDVIFQFPDEARHLGRVVVRTLDFSREHALTLHNSLLRALTETYGLPAETDSRGTLASMTKWTFRITTVLLGMYTDTGTRGPHATKVSITYASTAEPHQSIKDKILFLGLLRALGEAGRGFH